MSLHWRPVGPEPASTYWIRRAVVALAAILLLYGLLALLGGSEDPDSLQQQSVQPAVTVSPQPPPASAPSLGNGAAAVPTAGPSPGRSAPASSPSASTRSAAPRSSAEPPPCADGDLAVDARAEQEVYDLDDAPTLILSVRNTAAVPCRRELGQGAVELVVTSGRDRIWSSDDCAPDGPAGPTVLDPDEAAVTTVPWTLVRSRPGCRQTDAQVRPGTYVVSARVGDLRVRGRSFRLQG